MTYSQDPGVVSASQCLRLCHRTTSASLHANLLQSSNTAPNLPKNILQSTDEESINIILVCYERCLLSLQEWSGCFIPIVALIGGFLMKPFFCANCIQLGKISAHPIIGQSIQHLRVQYISKNSDAQRQWMNGMPLVFLQIHFTNFQ